MSLRFSKSIKLLPGVRVNLTERGVRSVSTGIPGSGLSYVHTVSGSARCFIAAAVLAVLALASCVAAANPINEKIVAASEAGRQRTFAHWLRNNGENCPSISRTFFQGSSKDGAAFWSVSCTGGKDWQVMIYNNSQGSTRLMQCDVLKMLGSTCFKRW